jgi:dTMP kinase
MPNGKIIVIDGVDGTGKATTTRKVIALLKGSKIFGETKILTTSFPNYNSFYGQQIRAYLDGDAAQEIVRFPTEIRANPLLASWPYAADRYIVYHTVMKDELSRGSWFIFDRFTQSNMAHQSAKLPSVERDEFLSRLHQLEHGYLGLPVPDYVFILSLPEIIRERRVRERLAKALADNKLGGQISSTDIHEQNLVYMAEVAGVYEQLAASNNWDLIHCATNNAEYTPEEIAGVIYKKIIRKFL